MANKRLNALITIGGAVASSLGAAIGQTTGGIGKIGEAVSKLRVRQTELNNVIKEQERLGKAGSAMKVQFANQELAALDKQIAKLKQLQATEKKIADARTANNAKRSELKGKIVGTVAMGVSAAAPIVQAVKFETAMLGIAKQVDGARDAGGKLTPVYYEMGRAIQKLGQEIPIPTNEIANMVTAAARMGIAKEDLIEFTRTAAMMSTAFEMPAAELTDNMGKIAGIFKIPMKSIAELGDAINYLDDNAISKGSDIIKVMQGDLAGAASVMGLSAKNAAALASTFLTLGESAERADTAASGMLRQLQIAKMNPKRFQVGVQMLGMTADQLQKGMIKDPQAMVLKVLEGIKKLPQEKQMEAVTRLFGKDWGGAIAKLAGGIDEYRKQLALANGEAAKGSMSREFSARMDTTLAKWELLKNTLTEFAVVTGEVALPAVKSVFDALRPYITALSDAKREHPLMTKAVLGTVFGLVALKVAGLGVAFMWTGVTSAWLAGRAAWAAAPAVMTAVGTALRFVGTSLLWVGRALLLNPIGLAVTAIAGAAILIWQNWDTLGPKFSALWDGIKSTFSSVYDWIAQKIGVVFGWATKIGTVATKVGKYVGIGVDTSMPVGEAPNLPMPAAAVRGTSQQYNDHSTTNMQIYQTPGEDMNALADKIEQRLKQKSGVKSRSMMFDGAN